MKAVVFAYHDIGNVGVTELIKSNFIIKAVITHSENNNYSSNNQVFCSVARIAAEQNITVFAPDDVNHPLWIDRIKKLKPDVIFSFYYRKLICKEIIELPLIGAFNLHGSLLPRYRGCAPLNWVLINGEKETGVTLHRMVVKADAGPIIAQCKIKISTEDDAKSLHYKLCNAASNLLKNILPSIYIKQFKEKPQNENMATYFSRRTPEDGRIDWNKSATILLNLIRALTFPWPGAFSYFGTEKFIIWKAKEHLLNNKLHPGIVLSIDPLIISCGVNAIEVLIGENNGICMQGKQLAQTLGLVIDRSLYYYHLLVNLKNRINVLILGVNGFIGNHLTERLLRNGRYEIYGLDIGTDSINCFMTNSLFHFVEGDISIHSEWIEYHIKKCDIILPLVAIATPVEYIRNPLRVFELDFEENLKIIRYCVKYKKRIIFPSTSEVYGMCTDSVFDEDKSNLIVGPIKKQRWIYSISKQLLDRVIWAYGEKTGLRFTLFRPFNWIGPRLDSLNAARIGSSRVITQLILNLVEGSPIKLVDGGEQKRCFTDISDGIEALFRIIENVNHICDGQIINIGNPNNEISIRQLAKLLLNSFECHNLRKNFPSFAGFRNIESNIYYGKGYQDVEYRKPSIRNAKRLLNWVPKISIEQTINETLDFFLKTVD